MVKSFFSKNFAASFITVFLPLFAIGSIILFISMASITSYIQVDFMQMIQIYGYSLPELLFYTLAVAFVVSVGVTLNKLSNDYELIVLFSAGITPFFVLRRLYMLAAITSAILLTLSLLLTPQTQQIYEAFKNDQVAHAKLNIKPSELGQSFGNFFVYVAGEDEEGIFEDVVVFQIDEESEQIFKSKEGEIFNKKGDTEFSMMQGTGHTYSDTSIERIDFEKMTLFQSSIAKESDFISITKYWDDRFEDSDKMEDFRYGVYISLMPLFTILAIAAFSIIHPRYQKSRLFPTLLLTIVSYLVIIDQLTKNVSIPTGLAVLLGLQIVSFYLFKKRVLRFF